MLGLNPTPIHPESVSGFGSSLHYPGGCVQFCSDPAFSDGFHSPPPNVCLGGESIWKGWYYGLFSVQVLVVAGVSMPQGVNLPELNTVIGW